MKFHLQRIDQSDIKLNSEPNPELIEDRETYSRLKLRSRYSPASESIKRVPNIEDP